MSVVIKTLNDCVATALAVLPDRVALRFAGMPRERLQDDIGLTVKRADYLTDSRNSGGWCDGQSYLADGVVLYRPTGNRRENFTLGHELGHWLVDQTDEIYDWLSRQDDGEKLLENVCDAVAQTLLIPSRAVDAALGGKHVSAQAVLNLIETTQASRPVCAIALARRLPGVGAVAILDRDAGSVTYSSVQPDPLDGWPAVIPWPGHDVPPGHPLLRVSNGIRLGRKLIWTMPWGTRQEFYVDAIGHGRYVLAVFADRDLWGVEATHFDTPQEFVRRLEAEIRCCGGTQQARGFPCPECHRLFCPKCGECLCTKRAANETTCEACGLKKAKHLIGANGICVDCE